MKRGGGWSGHGLRCGRAMACQLGRHIAATFAAAAWTCRHFVYDHSLSIVRVKPWLCMQPDSYTMILLLWQSAALKKKGQGAQCRWGNTSAPAQPAHSTLGFLPRRVPRVLELFDCRDRRSSKPCRRNRRRLRSGRGRLRRFGSARQALGPNPKALGPAQRPWKGSRAAMLAVKGQTE